MGTIPQYDDHLAERWGVHDPERRRAFVVDNDSKARWACDKREALEARMETRRREIQQQIAELKAWQAEQDAADQAEIAWFDDLLERYYQRLETDGKVRYGEKSYLLPNGRRLGYRLAEASWQVTDPAALFAWAKGKGYVRVKEEADWQDQVKPRLVALEPTIGACAVDRDSGEVIPGVLLQRPVGDVFVISIAKRRRVGGIEPPAQSFDGEHTDER